MTANRAIALDLPASLDRPSASLRLHHAGDPDRVAIWTPGSASEPARAPTTSDVLHRARAPENLTPEVEAAILAAIQRPLQAGETHRTGNDAREREVLAIFARLSPTQAVYLRQRLDRDRDDDPVAIVFRRLLAERRRRMRAFLADPRRHAGAFR